MKFNFAPNIGEKNTSLKGGAKELLSFSEKFLKLEDPCCFSVYKGFVFTVYQNGNAKHFTSLSKWERQLPYIDADDSVYVERITKERSLKTKGFTIVAKESALHECAQVPFFIDLFLAAEFSGWADKEVRQKNWQTIAVGKGPFRTVIVRKHTILSCDYSINEGMASPLTVRIYQRERKLR